MSRLRSRRPSRPVSGIRATVLSLVACVLAASGCASLGELTRDAGTLARYRLTGSDAKLRGNLERGLTRLKGENYEGATNSLNRAIWDLEGIGNHRLRIEELGAAYQALGNAYQGLGKSDWAEEHWRLSKDLADHAREDGGNAAPLTRAREAYSAARFREALGALRQALVDLEGVSDSPARLKQLEEARCYLAFAYFALDKEDRAREELHRLWVLDSSVSLCTREAPPVIRRLIGEVQKKREPR